ncbi:unnamed protein product (macronuclear) [Paramecium tetraurelia]|uniref:Uncharacterized protein n=1 Tax=Paramecium tetraurelia TaxID=5888 RepID=A0C7X0_PARTE|nr:uncharacterized protein GSPATT00036018001 [Paramecium tetraurelia]CAK66887.1 unnamed protein product [Paramecium tetraurelia]|eukprot:XP_001434284.1 hypothetical protein (macronuclear) [Paramecium tetraurelia strain d4-2]
MKFSSKSPTKTVKQQTSVSPNQVQKKVTHNYVEKTLVNKEVEYWKFKYMELEQFCQGKQSYEKLENELQIWKSKYQQLTLRARVAKGSELIIQEYQSRIQELNQQCNGNNYNSNITFSPSKRSEQAKQNELQNKIDQQQNEIRSLQNQIEELKQQSKQHTKRDIITTTNNSNYQSQNMFANSSSLNQQYIQQNMRLELELKNFEQENQSLQEQIQFYQHNLDNQQKIIDQQKLQINQLEQNLASEKLKQLKLMDQNAINLREQEIKKYQEEIFILSSKLRDCEKLKRQELNQKDEHYQEIISQLKLQIHNQIQSGEMRLSTLQNILQDKQLNSSFGRLNNDFYQQQNTNQSDKVIVRLDSEMKNLKSLINEDNNKQRFF